MRIVIFMLVLLSNPVFASSMLVLGDSLSAAYGLPLEKGWVNLMRERAQAQDPSIDVVNASVSGETTSGGLSRLPGLLETHAPAIVLIELGANDGLRGTPLNIVRDNLNGLVERAQASGAQVVLIGNRLPPNYGPQYTQAFFDLFSQVATEKGVALVPFLLEGVAEDWDLMQDDGYHPKAEAQPRLLETVWPQVAPLLADGGAKGA
ncbi:Arylesterase precursor [Marinobacterium lacunae]|uniref:Arylesterase n=1 Tax=Marinobacterium lacunae TaxID=1232683 RepID=A0A081FY98_9GAMM|nr:arylesterase [Marinobacterium lacunae]KEA63503.1 Arylesterase precursor [Marinobacterium lacunae]